MKKPAHRGATAGLVDAFRQVSIERYATDPQHLQAQRLSGRFGLSPALAAVTAAHAYSVAESWTDRA